MNSRRLTILSLQPDHHVLGEGSTYQPSARSPCARLAPLSNATPQRNASGGLRIYAAISLRWLIGRATGPQACRSQIPQGI
jgi:hypothetical protein